MINLIRTEPVRLVAAIQATLGLIALFGVPLTTEQVGGIVVAVAAWLAFVTRSQVTPNSKVPDPVLIPEPPEPHPF